MIIKKNITKKDLPYLVKIIDNISNTYPKVFLLYGTLGAGKTAFVKCYLKYLGVKEKVTSPTFLINKTYQNLKNKIFHYDLYRINSFVDLQEIGFEENLKNKNIVFIEWPNKIKNLDKIIQKNINKSHIVKIFFNHTLQEEKRDIKIQY